MSEEEKKAIEYLKRHIIPYYGNKGRIEFMLNDTILNLIDKQQKEIEELKKDKIALVNNYSKVLGEFIPKDKIREKIEEIKTKKIGASTGIYAIQVDVLEELLKEN